jgi:serine/threonine protein kinase
MQTSEVYTSGTQRPDIKYKGVILPFSSLQPLEDLPFDIHGSRVLKLTEVPDSQKPPRYFLHLDPIDSGGSGSIHYGWDQKINRRVIIKAIDDLEGSNFSPGSQEALIHGKQDHPNIVKIFDVVQKYNPMRQKNTTYLILEDLTEKHYTPLNIYLKNHPKGLEATQVAQIMDQVVAGLSYLNKSKIVNIDQEEADPSQLNESKPRAKDPYIQHNGSIYHRDIKPKNIMIGPDGQIKILDFSIATNVPESNLENSYLGTLGYTAPEVMEGNIGMYNEQTDVYACGVILYELLTGTPLFQINHQESIDSQIQTYIEDVKDFSPSFLDTNSIKMEDMLVKNRCKALGLNPLQMGMLLTRCLAPNPKSRFTSLDEFREELQFTFTPSHS